MTIATIDNVKEGMYFDLVGGTRNIYAMQVMECWPGQLVVRTGMGCMSKPYSEFMIVNPDECQYKYHAPYFEDNRQPIAP